MSSVARDSAETEALLDEAARGVPGAFEQLFARHRPWITKVISYRIEPQLGARFDDSDIVQETQLAAFRQLSDYLARRPMPFRLWLRRMAQERLRKARRHHAHAAGRTVRREVGIPDQTSLQLAQGLLDPGQSPPNRVANQELAACVRRALGRLHAIDREVLFMRVFEGLTHEEIAVVLEVEPDAVRQRYGRALLRLRTQVLSEFRYQAEP